MDQRQVTGSVVEYDQCHLNATLIQFGNKTVILSYDCFAEIVGFTVVLIRNGSPTGLT